MCPTATAELEWSPSAPAISPPSTTPAPPALPCWLTEAEAAALIMLCATSRMNGGSIEHEIFGKLGDLLRAFRR